MFYAGMEILHSLSEGVWEGTHTKAAVLVQLQYPHNASASLPANKIMSYFDSAFTFYFYF